MSTEIGQMFFIGIHGTKLLDHEAKFIVENNIGGVILMKRNVETPEQIRDLTLSLQSLRHRMADKAPLFIGIDMEGGRVARLSEPFTRWPAARKLGEIDSTSVAFRFALNMGSELKAVGINLDFAPCVDVFTNPKNQVIGDRAFSSDPEQVAKIASAVVRGYVKADVIPCAKHFPGHGNTLLDSHEDLPVEHRTFEELEACELVPFKKVFRSRLDMVMTSHICFSKIDPDWPVTLSRKFLEEILRGQLRYRNLIITDDLDMKALTKKWDTPTIATQALAAGANILLFCNVPESHIAAVDGVKKALRDGKISAGFVSESYKKILQLKRDAIAKPEPLSLSEMQNIVGHPDHLKLAKGIASGEIPPELLTQAG